MRTRMTFTRFLIALVLPLALAACKPSLRQTPPKTSIHAAPMVFHSKGGKVIHIEQLDDKALFEEGARSYKAQDFRSARLYYGRLTLAFPKSDYFLPGLYNLALTDERLQDYPKAIQSYLTILQRFPSSDEAKDAPFRLAAAYIMTKQWPEAQKQYSLLHQRPNLEASDRLEILASLGLSLFKQKKVKEAEEIFRQTLRFYQKASEKEYLGADFFAAMSQFYIGRIYDIHFRERRFRKTKEEMKEDLEFKASNLLLAQAHYVRTIRIRHPQWVVSSLFRIGEMYQAMYKDMLDAPIPTTLTAEEKPLYQSLLKKRIRILLDKAIYAFENNLRAAESFGMQQDETIEKTRKQLVALRQVILKEHLAEPSEKEEQSIRDQLQRPSSKPSVR